VGPDIWVTPALRIRSKVQSTATSRGLILGFVERTGWTDERLDDLARRMDAGFARVDADIRELGAEMRALRLTIMRVGGGIMAGLVGVIVAVLAGS